MEIRLGEGLRPVLQKGLQPQVGLGGEAHGHAVTQQPACVGVQDEGPKRNRMAVGRLTSPCCAVRGAATVSQVRNRRAPESDLKRT
jgi:hypothetical protein